MLRKFILSFLVAALMLPSLSTAVLANTGDGVGRYEYKMYPSDPTQTRIYTLDNGLTVYLSVNKDEPLSLIHI